MFIRVLTGKQPFAGTIPAPIGSQVFKQLFRQNGVAVFFALALLDPYQHPVRVAFDVMGFKADQFNDLKNSALQLVLLTTFPANRYDVEDKRKQINKYIVNNVFISFHLHRLVKCFFLVN